MLNEAAKLLVVICSEVHVGDRVVQVGNKDFVVSNVKPGLLPGFVRLFGGDAPLVLKRSETVLVSRRA